MRLLTHSIILLALAVATVSANVIIQQASKHQLRLIEPHFRGILEPLYGDQTVALTKMHTAGDRNTEVLVENGVIKGLLVYKTEPNHDYIPNLLEVKTFVLLSAAEDSRKGFGSILLRRVKELVHDYHMNGVLLTLSDAAPASAHKFFSKHGFIAHTRHEEKYIDGVGETVMIYEE